MRIGVLTSGGDCPGLNAVIRSVVHHGVVDHGDEIVGFLDGWKGMIDGVYRPLGLDDVSGLLTRGGTILGSAREERDKVRAAVPEMAQKLLDWGIDAVIPIGGEGTLTAARMFHEAGVPVVGVPKTIDNDIASTDVTFGFDTAVGVAAEALDRLTTTAESHQRIVIVEVMGRHTGWIALHSGMASGAHAILLPERPFRMAELCERIQARFDRGKKFALVVVAEGAAPVEGDMTFDTGATDIYGHQRFAGAARQLAGELERRIGIEARAVILGHVQRGGVPTAYDRVLATRFGWHAVEAVHAGRFGHMTALRGTDITLVPLAEAVTELKTVPANRIGEAEAVL
ncbi:ATP-dependent 6-phosphofructokinase [Allostreptomyces psammosilenae]|uniref:ATP-dependent 6-phosphofructokinase n=1 Tax=Allostreptomyces psammosilenae TaxID=1892865 RepID=A0A852ZST4_9ACTN|nr:ATP-dependent 6-phosphofructokinase [Allostreptomyces psammosilenae]NYI04320.1 6-phosphofructokinase 1 [Allostreptomyces psammosilenae]